MLIYASSAQAGVFSWLRPRQPIYSPTPVEATAPPKPTNSTSSSASVIATNRTAWVHVSWDQYSKTITNYLIAYGTNAGSYTFTNNAGTNLSISIYNLLPRTRYYFSHRAQDRSGMVTDQSAEVVWPIPYTNYAIFTVYKRESLASVEDVIYRNVITNPPGKSLFFRAEFNQANNQATAIKLPNGQILISNTNQP